MPECSTEGGEVTELSEAIERRFRAEWPGTHLDRNGHPFTAPPIRDGGATAAALALMLRIAEEETERLRRNSQPKRSDT
jgi:hypothetical protein